MTVQRPKTCAASGEFMAEPWHKTNDDAGAISEVSLKLHKALACN
jgi:hypothetical protein